MTGNNIQELSTNYLRFGTPTWVHSTRPPCKAASKAGSRLECRPLKLGKMVSSLSTAQRTKLRMDVDPNLNLVWQRVAWRTLNRTGHGNLEMVGEPLDGTFKPRVALPGSGAQGQRRVRSRRVHHPPRPEFCGDRGTGNARRLGPRSPAVLDVVLTLSRLDARLGTWLYWGGIDDSEKGSACIGGDRQDTHGAGEGHGRSREVCPITVARSPLSRSTPHAP